MLKRERESGVQKATLVPEFAVEVIPPAFGQNCRPGDWICSERLAFGENTLMMMMMMIICYLGKECGLKFLTFVLQLREKPGKTSTTKLIQPGIEPGPAV